MRHFTRSHLTPAEIISMADEFFPVLGMRVTSTAPRTRTFQGVIGEPERPVNVRVTVKAEGGHYAFVEVDTDQMGESRIDRNVKRFFVGLHRREEPAHALEAAY